eukprot:Opistho-1_new@89591
MRYASSPASWLIRRHREQAHSCRGRHKKAPRPNDTRGKKLVGCGQPKELLKNAYLLATVFWLPATTQGLVDRDDAAIQIDFGLGLAVFGVQAFALSVEQHEEVSGAFAVADFRQIGSLAARFTLTDQRDQTLLTLAVITEGVFRFFQGQQHLLLVGRQCAFGIGIGAAQTGTHAAKIERRPSDARAECPGVGRRGTDLRTTPGRPAEETAEADPREQVGLGHADPRGGRRQFAFGAEDVRTPLQQFARITDRQGLGNRRQVFRAQIDGEFVRTLTQQGGDTVLLPNLFGLQLRDAGFNRGQTRIGTFDVELITDAGVTQADGDLARLLLVVQVGHGDLLAQLRTAQLTVGVHQFGNHGDLQLVQIGFGRLLIGVAGFQVALDAAKQIDFPGHV